MTVGALIADYVFGDHFSATWIGTGYEFWSNVIENKASFIWSCDVSLKAGSFFDL